YPLMLTSALSQMGAAQRGVTQGQLDMWGQPAGQQSAIQNLLQLIGIGSGSPIVSEGQPDSPTSGFLENMLPWVMAFPTVFGLPPIP
ncbi:MAG: hypothetical protein ACXABY_09225, partial [Candidatus Thorarchaeota archaeon]